MEDQVWLVRMKKALWKSKKAGQLRVGEGDKFGAEKRRPPPRMKRAHQEVMCQPGSRLCSGGQNNDCHFMGQQSQTFRGIRLHSSVGPIQENAR